MERIEFCNLLAELRKNSGMTMANVCTKTKLLPPDVFRLEHGKYSFRIDRIILYLDAFDRAIVLVKSKRRIKISSTKDFAYWLKRTRDGVYSQQALAGKINTTRFTISNFELGNTTISIDPFLKIADLFGYTVTIEKK